MPNMREEAEKKPWYEKYFGLADRHWYFIIAGMVALVALVAFAYSVRAQETVTTTLFHRPEWTFNITGIGDQVSEFAKGIGKTFQDVPGSVAKAVSDFINNLICIIGVKKC